MTATIPNSSPTPSYEPFELDHDAVDDDHDDDDKSYYYYFHCVVVLHAHTTYNVFYSQYVE